VKNLFEYAVIRVMPRVDREEFLNVGLILYCAPRGFLQTRFYLDEKRLLAFFPELDLEELQHRLHAFVQICQGGKSGGTIGLLPVAQRFRWLTAARSTIVQTSPVHPGLCNEPEETLQQLFERLVL